MVVGVSTVAIVVFSCLRRKAGYFLRTAGLGTTSYGLGGELTLIFAHVMAMLRAP